MSREDRKLDHIKLALSANEDFRSDFDDLHFVHRSLPEASWENTCLETEIGGLKLSSPIFINAMTGGAMSTKEINRGLAIAARETGVAMAVGSQRGALEKPDLAETFRVVREVNPDGIVIANLGAGATPDEAKNAVDMLQADFLQLHLNIPQELVMQEGDRDFTGILAAIHAVAETCKVPVIVKEVGFGMSLETFTQLASSEIQLVDVGGRGGTNFIEIENSRRNSTDFSYLRNWGQSTAVSLLEARHFRDSGHDSFCFLASGGIRDALDIAKCLALGARGIGLAGPVLKVFAKSGEKGVIQQIENLHLGIRTIMTMLGQQRVMDMPQTPLIVMGQTRTWCVARNLHL